MRWWTAIILAAMVVELSLAPVGRCALTADQIVLVVNKNSPGSIELGRQYAAARNIPAGHTIELDLPVAEETDFNTYETRVVPPLRKFLRDSSLDQTTTCLLTFWGVPFRITSHILTPAEKKEFADLTTKLAATTGQMAPVVKDLESLLASVKPGWVAVGGDSFESLTARTSTALGLLDEAISSLPDPAARSMANERILVDLQQLGGDVAMADEHRAALTANPAATQDATPWLAQIQKSSQTRQTLEQLEEKRYDPAARAQMLLLAHDELGLAGYAQIITAQLGYLNPDQSTAALDNELAMLWWPMYGRSSYQLNELNYLVRGRPQVRTLMVMRLDAPTQQVVSDMIRTSVAVEKTGLEGVVAIDARGLEATGPGGSDYGRYDQMLRDLAATLKAHSRLTVVLDNTPELFHARQVRDVAVYVGWYSVRKYIPGCQFVPGAVGVHIASLELVGLHAVNETGWVHGLLNDGCVASMGAVDEPFLAAFPHPDEFFELLLTGKLTLAEVYWKTNPMTSWMLSMVGDPLYRPFGAHPALDVADLPGDLKRAIDIPATTKPASGAAAATSP